MDQDLVWKWAATVELALLNSGVSIRAKWHRNRLSMFETQNSRFTTHQIGCRDSANLNVSAQQIAGKFLELMHFPRQDCTESNSVSNTEVYVLFTDRSRKKNLDFCSSVLTKREISFL